MRRRILIGVLLVVAAITIGTAQTPAPSPQAAGRSLLVGQVIEAGSTTPIAGAVVTLGGAATSAGNSVIFSFSQSAVPGGQRQVVTDSQGHFVFSEIPAGTYTLQATKPGHSPGGFGKRRPAGWPQPVVVNGTTGVADLTIPIWKFATMSGTVTDEAGEPVVGIQLRAMRRIYENGKPQFSAAGAGMTADTDDRGAFRFTTLIPGEYIFGLPSTQSTVSVDTAEEYRKASAAGRGADFTRLTNASNIVSLGSLGSGVMVGDHLFTATTFGSTTVTPPPPAADGKVLVYPMTFHPSSTSPLQATTITLVSGENRSGADLHLKAVPGSRVIGSVSGPSGPMANMSLTLVPAATNLLTDMFFATATTVSDPRGNFVFLGVPPGQYVLQAVVVPRPTTAPPTQEERVAAGIPDGPTLWANLPITVDQTDLKGVSVVLQTGFRISGQVEFDGTAARPVGAISQRIAVFFEPLDDRSTSSLTTRRGSIDAAGRLTSYEMPPGQYHVRVQGAIPGWTFKGAMAGSRDVSDVPLDLNSGGVNVVLTFTDRPSHLSGVVRTSKGTPDLTAQVLAFPVDATSPTFVPSLRRLRSARVDLAGAYQFAALPPGEYFLVAVADDASADFPSPALIRALARSATRVKIADTGSVTQELTTAVIR